MAFEYQSVSVETVEAPGAEARMAHAFIETGVMTEVWAVAKNNLPEPHPAVTHEGALTANLRPRWRNVEQGRESLTAVGWFILSSIEYRFGSRRAAAKELNVSDGVLRQAGWSVRRR